MSVRWAPGSPSRLLWQRRGEVAGEHLADMQRSVAAAEVSEASAECGDRIAALLPAMRQQIG